MGRDKIIFGVFLFFQSFAIFIYYFVYKIDDDNWGLFFHDTQHLTIAGMATYILTFCVRDTVSKWFLRIIIGFNLALALVYILDNRGVISNPCGILWASLSLSSWVVIIICNAFRRK